MMVCLVEMMDLALKFLDTFAIVGSGKFEPARGCGRCGTINKKVVDECAEKREEEYEDSPDPLFSTNGIHKHPDLEAKD